MVHGEMGRWGDGEMGNGGWAECTISCPLPPYSPLQDEPLPTPHSPFPTIYLLLKRVIW
ncbi:MAG: hypothetical protein DSM106950_27235 [Stigonema ocellatum SAG 48.90 = DSM 106950]|nr:hypothetical protein [Stigonema ocellatum SAG 48.90 = DSM 106950]